MKINKSNLLNVLIVLESVILLSYYFTVRRPLTPLLVTLLLVVLLAVKRVVSERWHKLWQAALVILMALGILFILVPFKLFVVSDQKNTVNIYRYVYGRVALDSLEDMCERGYITGGGVATNREPVYGIALSREKTKLGFLLESVSIPCDLTE